ncbi:MAG TPA: hypothetical protein VMF62_18270 [Acetobacteraceae bacterium]|nr:hypothetical protein [Acetobacteraceae bacterium]
MSDLDGIPDDLNSAGLLTELDERERPAGPEGPMRSVRRWVVGSPAANKPARWLWLVAGIAVFANGVPVLAVFAQPPLGVRHLALIGLTELVMSAGSAVGVARFVVSFDPPPR